MRNQWVRLQAVAVSASTSVGLVSALLPLLAVSITTDPREVSWVNVAGQAPWLLLSFLAGLLVDRFRRTTMLALAYGIQVCLALALGIAGTAHVLSLPVLVVAAFVMTSTQVLENGAAGALVPDVVPENRLAGANARLIMIERGVVQFIVPPVTGLLMVVGAGAPAWLACGAAASGVLLVRGIRSSSIPAASGKPWREIADGLKFLVATPVLRSITLTVSISSFAGAASIAMLVLYATQILHTGSVGYGVLLACLAAGWVLSSFAVQRISTRLGTSWSLRIAQTAITTSCLLLAVVPPWPPLVGGTLVLLSAAALVWDVCSQTIRQRLTPRPLLGRVLISHRALAWGMTPLGALAGGYVAAYYGLRAVYVMVTIVHGLGDVIAWTFLTSAAFARAEAEMATRPATKNSS